MRVSSNNYLQNNFSILQEINRLKSTDAKVKAHEQAHIAAGAGVVIGGPNYTYQKGPDGKNYAVAGEVPISISKGKTPQETIEKMKKVIAAALAPADPSPQDLKVAATAKSIIANEEAKIHKIDIYA